MDTDKRCCFQSLPATLVLHLKRFELNYDTFQKQKVNSRCEFPHVLDMYPYTLEGLRTGDGKPEGPNQCRYQLKGVLVHSGTANNGHYYSFIKERAPAGSHVPEADLRWFQVRAILKVRACVVGYRDARLCLSLCPAAVQRRECARV